MKFHALHCRWLGEDEVIVLFGFAAGRVSYEPLARWLYSFRLFCGLLKVEILWISGQPEEECLQ